MSYEQRNVNFNDSINIKLSSRAYLNKLLIFKRSIYIYLQSDKIVDTFTFLTSISSLWSLFAQQGCVAIAMILNYKWATLNVGKGSSTVYCSVKGVVLLGALKVLLKDNVSTTVIMLPIVGYHHITYMKWFLGYTVTYNHLMFEPY